MLWCIVLDLEGSEVLEALARVGAVDAFLEAVDADDGKAAARLLRRAGLDPRTVDEVLRQMADG